MIPHKNKLIWTPDELKLLVDKTISKIVKSPFKEGRSFLHHIVADLLTHDEEVKMSVRAKNILRYEDLRDCGFIPAFHRAWEKIHTKEAVQINIIGGGHCQAATMPLHKLLEITRQRIADEFEPMAQTPGLGESASRELMPKLNGLIARKLSKETVALVLSPGRYNTAVTDLRRRVHDVLELDLVTTKAQPVITPATTQVVMLEHDPIAAIQSIGTKLARSLKKTEVQVVRSSNWRAAQDHIIARAAYIRKQLGMV